MAFNVSARGKVEERMEYPAVKDVDLRGFDLPLADVLVPRLKLPDDESVGKEVEVIADCRVGDAERTREL